MIAIILASLLLISDPANDVYGDGTLIAPTADSYGQTNNFDVTNFEVLSGRKLSFSLSFSALENPFNLPNGFSFPIIELYFSGHDDGSSILLPGSGMTLPKSTSWQYAFRITGDNIQLFQAHGTNSISDISDRSNLNLQIDGSTITVSSNLSHLGDMSVFGLVGLYTPFNETGWQAISFSPSPWAFSSESQTLPVIEVIANSVEAQKRSIATKTLPVIRSSSSTKWSPWLLLMLFGPMLALFGILSRYYNISFSPASFSQAMRSFRTTPWQKRFDFVFGWLNPKKQKVIKPKKQGKIPDKQTLSQINIADYLIFTNEDTPAKKPLHPSSTLSQLQKAKQPGAANLHWKEKSQSQLKSLEPESHSSD